MAVGGIGVGVVVGVTVGKDVGVFWAGWKGVGVASTSTTGGVCGTQAATVKIRPRDSSFFLNMDFIG